MSFYETPANIVRLIKKHVPASSTKILDPAVGEGALLFSLSAFHLNRQVTIVDIDDKRLSGVLLRFPKSQTVNEDFLSWSSRGEKRFDLIVANPPFSGKSHSRVIYEGRKVPIELAFIRRSVELLEENGSLIAIVPDSLINSSSFLVDRKWLFTQGEVRYVYQLPENSFFGIEAAFFLVVFKKAGVGGQLRLRKLEEKGGGEEITVSKVTLEETGFRLDYLYYAEREVYGEVVKSLGNADLSKLGDICDVSRGRKRSNYKSSGLIHTDCFESGFWVRRGKAIDIFNVERWVVAVRRVSRNAHLTFGIVNAEDEEFCTDCLIIVRPDCRSVSPIEILFYLRVMYSNLHGGFYLLKGVGAKFLSVEQIKSLPYYRITSIFREEFSEYCNLLFMMDFEGCKKVEERVFLKLAGGGNVESFYAVGKSKEKDEEEGVVNYY
ncbi:N-6 DNA methylase [Aidingimonas lacisalsi]|uniref:N-6 DNA methylase n=1 Tax=Aidingimonas lacisalsi TaxID=2604086 RepID=UPI0011D21116|nr:N-6 DNA methylase [Aidingimonas lacisalsi]